MSHTEYRIPPKDGAISFYSRTDARPNEPYVTIDKDGTITLHRSHEIPEKVGRYRLKHRY